MEWLNNICNAVIIKLQGTEVECAVDEEITIAKAEVKLAELSVEIQEETAKITDADVMKAYTSAVARIRAKQGK